MQPNKNILLILVITLSACATTKPAGVGKSAAKNPPHAQMNLSGYSAEFKAGYNDGCMSAKQTNRKDEARFKTDLQYAQGWRDGYDICRKR